MPAIRGHGMGQGTNNKINYKAISLLITSSICKRPKLVIEYWCTGRKVLVDAVQLLRNGNERWQILNYKLEVKESIKKSFGKQYFPLVEFQEDVNLSVRFHLNKKYFSSSLGQMTMDSAHSCRRHDHKATKSTATDKLSAPRA